MVPPLGMQQQPPQTQRAFSDPRMHRSQSALKAVPPTRSVSFQQRSVSTARAMLTARQHGHPLGAAQHPPQHSLQQQQRSQIRSENVLPQYPDYADDPEQVARAILDLRERREQQPPRSSSRGKKRSNSRGSRDSDEKKNYYLQRTASAPLTTNTQQTTTTTTTASAAKQSRLSPRSPEEQRATANIRKAEDKIDGLMQELEDLRFLEEIDLQDAAPPPAAARSQSMPRPRENMPMPLKTPRGDTIPSVVQAISPPAAANSFRYGGRLPPPVTLPPVAEATMVQQLSPRKISKMDRMALELETQTLCRKIDVLQKEKLTLEKAVEMYELTVQDQERQDSLVKKLGRDLQTVGQQLQQAKQDLVTVREQVGADYEGRLHENLTKLQRIQAVADQYRQERDTLHQDLEMTRKEYKDSKQKWNNDMSQYRTKLQTKEAVRELQLQELTNVADDLQNKLESEKAVVREMGAKLKDEIAVRDADMTKLKAELRQQKSASNDHVRKLQHDLRQKLSEKDGELSKLRDNLRKSEQALEATKTAKDEAYEVRLSSLQEQLSVQKNKYVKSEAAKQEAKTKVQEQDKQIQQFKKECSEQAALIKDMTNRLDSTHSEYRTKFAEMKEAYEGQEKRRIQDTVRAHSSQVDEYERRLKALQEQLAHQTNRHHAEIEQKDRDVEDKLETQNNLKVELQIEHGKLMLEVEEKLARVRQDYSEADAERRRLRHELDEMLSSKEDALKERQELECQDILRAGELSRLREKAERTLREIASKDSRIRELSNNLAEAEKYYSAKLAQIESEHANSLLQHEEKATEQINAMRSTQYKLLSDLEGKDADLVELKTLISSHDSESERLLREISDKDRKLRDMSNTLIEADKSHAATLIQIKTEHANAISQCEEQAGEQIKVLRSTQYQLMSDLEGKDVSLVELKTVMASRVSELQDGMDKANKEMELVRRLHEESEAQLRADISVLEGKLRSADASIKEKSEDLEEFVSLVRELQAGTEKVKKELETARRFHGELEAQLRADISFLDGKLLSANSTIKEKNEAIEEYEEKLSLLSNQTIENSEAHRAESQRLRVELQDLNKQFALERAELNEKIQDGDDSLREKADLVTKLEGMLSNAASKEEAAERRVKELEVACREAKAKLIVERTRHESAEEQTRVDMAVLQGKLRASEASLNEKRETIEELEDKLRNIADESSSTNKELQKEVDQLRIEMKKMNDMIDKSRAALFTKDDLLKQQQKKLHHNAEVIASLQSIIEKKTQMEEDSSRSFNNLKSALDQAKIELASERTRHASSEKRLREQLVSIEAQLRESESNFQRNCVIVADLEEKLRLTSDKSTASVKEMQKEIEKQMHDIRAANELLDSERQTLQEKNGQIVELEKVQEELREKVCRLEEVESRMSVTSQSELDARKELESLKTLYNQSTKELEAEQTRRRGLEARLSSSMSELEEKLRDCNSNLIEKQDAIKDLEVRLSRASDESATSTSELQNELSLLKRDLKMSNELLNKERGAMDAKVEEFERLKLLHWNLRQKAARIDKLESTIDDLQGALSKAVAEKNENEKSYELSVANASVVKELEGKLEAECKGNEDLRAKLAEIEADLEIKEHQLTRLPGLQAQLKQLIDGREELQSQLCHVEAELERKDKEIVLASELKAESTSELLAEVNKRKKSEEALKEQLRRVEAELVTKTEHANRLVDELRAKLEAAESKSSMVQQQLSSFSGEFSAEAQASIGQLTRTKASLEAKIRELEGDRETRESQVRESSERYSNQILELQIKVEELTRTKISLKSRLSRVEADLEHKDDLMSATSTQLSCDVSELESELGMRLAENESLKTKLQAMEVKVADFESAKEIQLKLDVESKEKRSLLSKIGDIEAELQRKEKQIKDIVDRYTRDIAELEDKLEDEIKSNAALQKNAGKLSDASELNEARLSKERVEKALVGQQRSTAALQMELDQLRSGADTNSTSLVDEKLSELTRANVSLLIELDSVKADAEKNRKRFEDQLLRVMNDDDTSPERKVLEEKLCAVEKSKAELEDRLKKVNGERTEVITALEEVINEVQSREEEIEALANILRKRDEELEHAKLIATKALASAQDIKTRYRVRDGERQADLTQKVAELNSSLDFLSKKNDSLERKTTRMERELQEREIECSELRDKLHCVEKSKERPSETLDEKKTDKHGFQSLKNGVPTFETCSPTQAGSLVLNDTMSTQSAELHGGSGWLHDFDSHSTDSEDDSASFTGVRTEPSESQSRRSIERDALRKYVRKRYMKSKGSM